MYIFLKNYNYLKFLDPAGVALMMLCVSFQWGLRKQVYKESDNPFNWAMSCCKSIKRQNISMNQYGEEKKIIYKDYTTYIGYIL